MIKRALVILMLTLSACTSAPDLRPHAFIQSEQLMQQGIKAYQQDHYPQAMRFFSKAIVLYQSIDDQERLLLARINLIRSALAISQFQLAEQTFSAIAENPISEPKLSAQISQLKAHHLFLQQHYQAALQTFFMLAKQIPAAGQPVSPEQLNVLFNQTKFAIFAQATDAIDWFQRLTMATSESPITSVQTALFKRLAAHIALKKGDKEQAQGLMQQALDLYKAEAKRRAIASCLEELAQIHLARQDKLAAKATLKRALIIRQWLKDTYKTQLIMQQLQALNTGKSK